MSALEVVLDGATEPPAADGSTSLRRAHTPELDALATSGRITLRRTTPDGLPVGTETALPVLLGWTPPAPVDRAALEAAAHGIDVPVGTRAVRIDGATGEDLAALAATGFAVHALDAARGHLAIGPGRLPALSTSARVWSAGLVPPTGVLDATTVVIAARGAASGAATLLGARVVVPDGATGDTDTDLRAKTAAALAALEDGATRIVVHVGAPDAAAHRGDEEAKVCAIEAADRYVIGPLRAAVAGRTDTSLAVGADHGCDPATGRHDGDPVPWVLWSP
ncbi:hypothetical protein [Paraconexibacter sp.]|uniref:hypothetical protein n=1 Tax=Paraconexibacter sp. TaxID=2949640 RepID=UPI0035657EC5